jgi:hypothetical protein
MHHKLSQSIANEGKPQKNVNATTTLITKPNEVDFKKQRKPQSLDYS